jgi:hypothetical protein
MSKGITIYFEDGKVLPFTHHHGDGFSTRSAQFLFADGSEHQGVVDICDQDQGEHYGSSFLAPDGELVRQGEPDFLERLGKKKGEVTPYHYRYNGWKKAVDTDHHIGVDGWSR